MANVGAHVGGYYPNALFVRYALNGRTAHVAATGGAILRIDGGAATLTETGSASGGEKPGIVPPDAQEFRGHWYRFYAEQMSWKAARDRCRSLGGQLVIINSPDENDFVGGLVAKAAWQDAWIGATDEAEEGRWRHVDGKLISFTNWLPIGKQPNNKNNEEHYALISNRSVAGAAINWRWADQPNEAKDHQPGFVCEWNAKAAEGAAAAGSPLQKPDTREDATNLPRGRFVRIELPRTGTISLAEVEVYCGGRNIARSGKATQKNIGWGGQASRGIDGNTSGIYNNGGATHTEHETPEPWWEVDLGDSYSLVGLGDRHNVWSLAFGPVMRDRKRQPTRYLLAAGGEDGEVRTLTVALTKTKNASKWIFQATKVEFPKSAPVLGLRFSHDGRLLGVSRRDGNVCLYDPDNGGQPVRVLTHGNGSVEGIAFHPQQPWCVTAHKNEQVARIWNIDNGDLLCELKGHTGGVMCAEFSPDGRRVATASEDFSIKLWNLSGGDLPEAAKKGKKAKPSALVVGD